jgi:hypothetical protein
LLIGPHLLVQKTHSKILIRRVGWVWLNSTPKDFDSVELRDLGHHISLHITADVQVNEKFSNIQIIVDLSRVLVETRKYCESIFTLSFGLPAKENSTSIACCHNHSWEMLFVHEDCESIFTQKLSENIICYMEKKLKNVTNDSVVERFMKLRGRIFEKAKVKRRLT